jgi:ubiquinone/menaquinone biosynthesis C-methylase UbiE
VLVPEVMNFIHKPPCLNYDEVAVRFDERYKHQSFSGIQVRLRQLANAPGVNEVLEVGCGTGHWLSALSDLPLKLLGIDPSCTMLNRARARARTATFVCGCAESIPLRPHSFDLIFCVNAFHHFSNPEQFLRDSNQLLRKSGRLAIFGLDPHAPGIEWYLYDYFAGVKDMDLARYLPHEEIKHLMIESGFQHVTSEPAERIRKTFVGEAVLSDPFLERSSTSQLMVIPEESYLSGKRRINLVVEQGKQGNTAITFTVDLMLFTTVGETQR